MTRTGEIERETRETTISVTLDLDGKGTYEVATGNAMVDHLMDQLARHGSFDLKVHATAHQDPDGHHLAEDVALALGRAFDQALGDRAGITRMASATVPMDDALTLVAVDIAGRGHATIDLPFKSPVLGELRTELVHHMLSTFAQEARMTLHVRMLAGENDHHIAEGAFKALARALREAVSIDLRLEGQTPSTKGVLS